MCTLHTSQIDPYAKNDQKKDPDQSVEEDE